jgi:hypothetical protein
LKNQLTLCVIYSIEFDLRIFVAVDLGLAFVDAGLDTNFVACVCFTGGLETAFGAGGSILGASTTWASTVGKLGSNAAAGACSRVAVTVPISKL